MYDGTLPQRPPSSSSPSNNAGDGLDSSESESESDMELRSSLRSRWVSSRSLRDIPSPRRHRWRPPSVERQRRNFHAYANYTRLRSSTGGRTASSSTRPSYNLPRPPVPTEAIPASADIPLVDGEDASEDLGSERLPPLR